MEKIRKNDREIFRVVTLNFTQYEVGELERYLDKLKEYIKKDEPKKHDRFDDRKYDIER